MQYDREKLGAYLASKHPDKYGPFSPEIQLMAVEGPNGEILAEIVKWMEGSPFPDLDEVNAIQLQPKEDPWESLKNNINSATTVAGLRTSVLQLLELIRE